MSRPIAPGKKYIFNRLKVLVSLAQSLLLNQSFSSDWLCLVYSVSSTWCAFVRLGNVNQLLTGLFLPHVPLSQEMENMSE